MIASVYTLFTGTVGNTKLQPVLMIASVYTLLQDGLHCLEHATVLYEVEVLLD